MRGILETLHHFQKKSTIIFCDNVSTISLSKNAVLHGRSKHIHIHYHFIRELSSKCIVNLVHCRTNERVADVMIKALELNTFEEFRKSMRVIDVKLAADAV